jgi:hypothetical protein
MASAIEIFAREINNLKFLGDELSVDCGIHGVYTIKKAYDNNYFYCWLHPILSNKFNMEQIMDFLKVFTIKTITFFHCHTYEEQDVFPVTN